MLSLGLEIAGLLALIAAGFMVAPVAGVVVLGLSLMLVGYFTEDA